MKLLVISLDALSNEDLSLLQTMPNFKTLADKGTLVTNVNSTYVSNTYPIHTSMITGVHPKQHGIYDNCYFEQTINPHWRWYYSLIKHQNIVGTASKARSVATIFWPVMCQAPSKYNIPEIIARDGENQIIQVLRNSTKLFALMNFLRFGQDVKGASQPALDNFSIKTTLRLLTHQKPDLVLLHLTDTDTQKHDYGIHSQQVMESLQRMDDRLGQLSSIAKDYQILVVSDHAQLDAQNVDLNQLLPGYGWWYQTSGSAILLTQQPLTDQLQQELMSKIEQQPSILRLLTVSEMELAGFNTVSQLGLAAKSGYAFNFPGNEHLGNHGYPTDYNNYQPFYLVVSPKVNVGKVLSGGTIFDVCPLMCELLNLTPWPMDGKLLPGIIK
jgi:hypothetical protein